MVMRRRFFNNNIKNFDINDYLTIEALEDNLQVYFPYEDLMYGIDGLGWQKLIAGAYSPAINKGQTISFKGNVNSSMAKIKSFTITKRCNLLGNCMSLTLNDVPHFYGLFIGCTTIVYISKDFLPAKTLTNYCYGSMFQNCTSLVNAPELPATTLADNCYNSMFQGCKSLVNAPALPATTLVNYCYDNMFSGCTSLTSAPELPATALVNYCYQYMFYGCTSLTSAPALPATALVNYCYQYMFYGCTSLTSAPALPATTLASYCYQYMFYGCTSLTSAPELPATTLASSCYGSMFDSCTSLTTAPELPATTLANYCYDNMFSGCTSLTSAPELPATTLASSCYGSMFQDCTSLVNAPELPATKLATSCYYNMFDGCTSLTTAPELPATTLATNCYRYMFYKCRSLNYIKMLATDISATDCLSNWVSGVASTGTFVKNSAMNSLPTGINGIPSGWTVVNDGEESGGELLEFTVRDTATNIVYGPYQFEEGMTGNNFYNSEYCVSPLVNGTGGIYIRINGFNLGPFIAFDEVIQPIQYTVNSGGGSGEPM